MFVLGCYFQQFHGFILKLVARDFGHRKCVQVSLMLAHIGTLILMNPFLQMSWSIIYVVDSPHVWFVTLVISDESPLIFPKENASTWVLMIYLWIPEGLPARQVPCLCRTNEASTCRGVLEGDVSWAHSIFRGIWITMYHHVYHVCHWECAKVILVIDYADFWCFRQLRKDQCTACASSGLSSGHDVDRYCFWMLS